MGVEIERKFLVKGDAWRALGEAVLQRQGYLSSQAQRVVRVRVEDGRGMITIKGPNTGASRGEWEYPIPLADANELLTTLCERPLIEKMRHRIKFGGMVWEVDEFLGANQGLVVAEIELASEDQPFDKPDWIGDDVTGQARYYNSSLVLRPYSQWAAAEGGPA